MRNTAAKGWEIQLFLITCALQLLYLIEYANFNSQIMIGRGVVDIPVGTVNHSIVTGATNNLGNASGRAIGTDGSVSISYRGIENLWGNIWKWVDGCNINNNILYIADNAYQTDVFTGAYKAVDWMSSLESGYVSNIGYSSQYDYLFVATSINGSNSTYLTDNYFTLTGARASLFGGAWNTVNDAGIFCWNLGNASNVNSRTIGTRLCYM